MTVELHQRFINLASTIFLVTSACVTKRNPTIEPRPASPSEGGAFFWLTGGRLWAIAGAYGCDLGCTRLIAISAILVAVGVYIPLKVLG